MSDVAAPAGQARTQQIIFSGNTPAFLGVAIINALLTIVTLGIFRFWAKTRIRRYLWENTTFDGEPLEYRGRGLELFVGAILGTLIIFVPVFLISIVAALVDPNHPAGPVAILSRLVLFGGLYYLFGVGYYRAERYLISRSSWRGIRGGMTKGGWSYGGWFILMMLFQIVTLGFGRPYAQVRLWNMRMNDVMFGSVKAEANAEWRPLFVRYALSFIAAIVIYGVVIGLLVQDFMALGLMAQPGAKPDPHVMLPLLGKIYGMIIVASVAVGLIMLSYHAAYYREILGKTRLGGLAFGFTATTGSWFKYYLVNVLIVVLTLGLGLMVMPYRAWKFYMTNLLTDGALDIDHLMQTDLASPSQGEGLADALGFSVLPF
ncbi:MAG TPA: DUF898 family protein [Alphaproteobacteria bacterium]|nr:DUF898 family protein [Alphaproteobacteria bacterium]